MILDHATDIQIFQTYGLVITRYLRRYIMQKILTLIRYFLVKDSYLLLGILQILGPLDILG